VTCRVLLVKLLLHADVAVNERTHRGETALHYAIHVHSTECVRALLRAGADASARGRNGATPLGLAVDLPSMPPPLILLLRQVRTQELASRRRTAAPGSLLLTFSLTCSLTHS